jgi:hypothetical protein
MQKCLVCKAMKPLEQFAPKRGAQPVSTCLSCRERIAAFGRAHAKERNAANKARYTSDPEYRARIAKNRHKYEAKQEARTKKRIAEKRRRDSLDEETKLVKNDRRRSTRLPAKPLTTEQKQRIAEWRKRRIEQGICVACTEPAVDESLMCERHYFKSVARNHGLSNEEGSSMLKALWDEQGGRCSLTGKILIRGTRRANRCASLDHKIPLAAGGSRCKANLHWVMWSVNAAKADLLLEDFIEMCREVVAYSEK